MLLSGLRHDFVQITVAQTANLLPADFDSLFTPLKKDVVAGWDKSGMNIPVSYISKLAAWHACLYACARLNESIWPWLSLRSMH